MLKPTVEVRLRDGTMIAEFWDCLRLDPAPVTQLRHHFEDHLRAGGAADLIVDLNGVEFAGSSALGGFLSIQRIGRQKNGRIIFCNVEPQVREVFRVSKLDTLFLFAADVAAALRTLGVPRSEPPGPEDGPGSGPASPRTPPGTEGGSPPSGAAMAELRRS